MVAALNDSLTYPLVSVSYVVYMKYFLDNFGIRIGSIGSLVASSMESSEVECSMREMVRQEPDFN